MKIKKGITNQNEANKHRLSLKPKIRHYKPKQSTLHLICHQNEKDIIGKTNQIKHEQENQ